MRRYLIISILLLLGRENLCGQAKYIFYNEKGQLIADTNYKINKKQLEKFIPIEDSLAKYIWYNMDFPEWSKDRIDTGNIIVSFKINTTDSLQQIRIEKTYEKKNYLSNEVKRVFKTIRLPKSAYSKYLRDKKYFLAIRFELRGIDGVKYYKHVGFIEILKYKTPLLRIVN